MTKKNMYLHRFVSFCLIFALIFSIPFTVSSANDDPEKEIKALEDELAQIELERARLRSSINSAKAGQSTQYAIKKNLDSEITLITSEISTTTALIEQYEKNEQNLIRDIEKLEKECSEQEEMFDELFRLSFKYGDISYLELIFSSESFAQFLSRLDFIATHLKHSETVLTELSEKHEKLKISKMNLEASKEKLKGYKESNEALQVTLNNKLVQTENTITKLVANQKEWERALAEADAEMDKLHNEIMELAKTLDLSTPYIGGAFLWPVPNSYTRISSPYGYRINPKSKKREFHNGIDLPAPRGTKIYAVASGTVVKAQWNGGYGNCVVINHGGGIMTLYGHCNSLNVKVGQYVSRGDVIAYVGTTGYSTGNHLHFTVYENGSTHVDPMKYLK